MNKSKKILTILFGIIIFLGLSNFGLNIWVKAQLPKLINNANNTDYFITYDDIDLSIWKTKIALYDVTVKPKISIKSSNKKIGLYGNIKLIKVNKFAIWSILFGEKIKADNVIISEPSIILYKNNKNTVNDYKNINAKVIKPFEKIIIVNDLFLNKGNMKVLAVESNETLASATNLNFKLEGIVVNKTTLNQKIPISYERYSLICDSLFYDINSFYNIKSNKVSVTEKGLNLKQFELLPKFNRREFIQKLPQEKDIFTILADDISINNLNWGFSNDAFFFKTSSIILNKVKAAIYRGKMPEDDLTKKELYNNLLRNLKSDIKVDTLLIKDSFLTYEEEKTFDKGAGKLFFSNFNMLVQDLESGFNKTKLPDVKIQVNCDFMKKSPLKVDWSFNVLDKTEGFKIAGSIFKFDTEELENFTKPYMNVKIKGILDEVYFDFTGNDIANKGKFSLKYDDLNVEIYQNDKRLKKNKFLSAIGNLFVKNDSDEEIKIVKIDVQRNQEKSFFNFLWISIADGLKQILL